MTTHDIKLIKAHKNQRKILSKLLIEKKSTNIPSYD